MFQGVRFNTEDKMMSCFRKMLKEGRKYTHTFHLVEPARSKDYMVYYLPRMIKRKE